MGKVRREKPCGRLKAVFGGEMATAKIQTVKGLRVEIFSRTLRKNTTRPLKVWIVGADIIADCLRWRNLLYLSSKQIDKSESYRRVYNEKSIYTTCTSRAISCRTSS